MVVTKTDIVEGLKGLGLQSGCRVLCHSSLSSFGYVEGGADTVIDSLLEVVGPAGTVLVPTLTGSELLSKENPPVFSPDHSPCWTGRIPETFRQRPDAIRSLHPTHSVAAMGADAVTLTQDHIQSVTPCDEYSPYARLTRLPDSYILLIGVSHNSSTTFHWVEEYVGVDYHLQQGFVRAEIHVDDKPIIRHIILHAYGTRRNFEGMNTVFIERGIQFTGKIGDAEVRLVKAQEMFEVTARFLRADKAILCLK